MRTLRTQSQYLVEIEHSKFICFLYPCETSEEAQVRLKQIRKDHPKANHHCYAYVLREDNQKSSDDGEPAGTAGIPILSAIKEMELEQILVVIVRYFGGVKLGASGLLRAYHSTALAALQHCDLVRYEWFECYNITLDYSLFDRLLYHLKQMNIKILEIHHDIKPTIKVAFSSNAEMNELDHQYQSKLEFTYLGKHELEQ